MNWDEAKKFLEEFKKISKIQKPCFESFDDYYENGNFVQVGSVCDCDEGKKDCSFVGSWEDCEYGQLSDFYEEYINLTFCPFCNRRWPKK